MAVEKEMGPREWALTQLAFGGHKKRIKLALKAIDAALIAMKDDPDDHPVKVAAVKLVAGIYGLDAERQSRITLSGDPDNPLQGADSRYLDKAVEEAIKRAGTP